MRRGDREARNRQRHCTSVGPRVSMNRCVRQINLTDTPTWFGFRQCYREQGLQLQFTSFRLFRPYSITEVLYLMGDNRLWNTFCLTSIDEWFKFARDGHTLLSCPSLYFLIFPNLLAFTYRHAADAVRAEG